MSDTALRDQAVTALAAELVALKATTRGLKGYTPTAGSQWAKVLAARQQALLLLTQIGAASPPPPPPPSPSGMAPPAPPSPYAVPAVGTVVGDSASLLKALAANPTALVLRDGTYDNPAAFKNPNAIPLIAQNLGKAILTAGLELGTNNAGPGALLQGLVVDVRDPSKAALDGGIVACVDSWGAGGSAVKLRDMVLRGNKTIGFGLHNLAPAAAEVQRVQAYDFTEDAFMITDNQRVAYGQPTHKIALVNDILIDGVSRATPGASNGTAEAGLLLGNPVVGGVNRIKIRNVSWSGILTANNAWDTTFADLDIDMTGPNASAAVAFYMEHYSYHLTVDGFAFVVPAGKYGAVGEWDYGIAGNSASHFNAFKNGLMRGGRFGIGLDYGAESTTVLGVAFEGQTGAAISAYQTIGTNDFERNDYSKLAPGAVAISYAKPQ